MKEKKRSLISPRRRQSYWEKVDIGPTADVYVKRINSDIMNSMPESTRTFLEVGFLERLTKIFVDRFIRSGLIK